MPGKIHSSSDLERDTPARRSAAAGWLQLTPAEASLMLVLPFDVRVISYIGRHANDRCPQCNFLIGSHTLAYFKVCAASELGKFSLELLEVVASEVDA